MDKLLLQSIRLIRCACHIAITSRCLVTIFNRVWRGVEIRQWPFRHGMSLLHLTLL